MENPGDYYSVLGFLPGQLDPIRPDASAEFVNRENHSGKKYMRTITLVDGRADVYAVLDAFGVTCPARQHAIKKLLCAGLRGKGDELQDLREARDAVDRAVEMCEARGS